MTAPLLDPDAAARVASFGDVAPMRQRGLAAVRAALESAPRPDDMPEMASINDTDIPAPGWRRSRPGSIVPDNDSTVPYWSTCTAAGW